MIDFSVAPYNDDYNENNGFHRILFRPGLAVQARELTQLQTILQNQIKRHGEHTFENGAMVIPGQVGYDLEYHYVKIESTYNSQPVSLYLNALIGKTLVGQITGLRAIVVNNAEPTETDPTTLYVKYLDSGTSGETKVFANSEILTTDDLAYSVQALPQIAGQDATGKASAASIQRGVYFINGHFVLADEQTIVLDKYTNSPSYRVGLRVDEQIVVPEDDQSLLDNAQGSYNFSAPGAHRYYIGLELSKLPLDSTADSNFIELLKLTSGEIQRIVNKTEYSVLENTLARRTFDESGNYTVRPFIADVREHRSNDRGQWLANTQYLIGDVVVNNDVTYVAKRNGTSLNNAPVHTSGSVYDGPGNTGVEWEYNESPVYNRGIYKPEQGGSESKLAIGLSPGKAYVQGYEIEKVSTEYVAVNKARTDVQVDNAVIPATVGNHVLVTSVSNLPPVNSFATITLYNRLVATGGSAPAGATVVGTARARFIEWDNGTIGTSGAIYKLGLFDIRLNNGFNFNRDVKSFVFSTGDVGTSFTANISPIQTRLVGSATAAGTTVTGTGTSFITDLRVGDYISLGGNYRRVVTIPTQNSLTVDASVTVTGSTIFRLSTTIREPENLSLVFPLAYSAIKTVRSALNTNDTTYTVYERYSGICSAASGGVCTLTLSTTNGTFASAAETDNYIVADNSPGTGGTIIAPNNINVVSSSVVFTLPDTYASKNVIVIATVNKSGPILTEKTKTLSAVTTVVKTTLADATASEILLGKADCYKLLSVRMKTGTFASPGPDYSIDITERYEFDNGQRDTHYDIGRIKLKTSFTPPTAPIEIRFTFFTHSDGDYFTVDSYGDYSTDISNTTAIGYKDIPVYKDVPLRDCIDFRPRISDNGVNFTNTGASMALVPKRGLDVRADYRYYLGRKSKIAISFAGDFFTIDGVSSLNPSDAEDPSIGMVLYNVTLEPYTFDTTANNVITQMVDNKRYTMRDIGKLENRINNLEYYTSLSLLEQQTESLDILDSNGDSRFKNGFIVDGFTGHNTGDVNSADYLCSIDMSNGELRPFFTQDNIELIEKNSTTAARVSNNYKLYGDIITLPVIDHVPLVTQSYASRLENINPFAVFTFIGNVELNPSSDTWFETNRLPDVINNVEGNFDIISRIAEESGVLGTIWDSWENSWTGQSVSTLSNQRLRDRGIRDITTETTATTVGQTRTGITTSIAVNIDQQVVGDRVVSTSIIPFIRSRNILIQVQGLKPNTKFYPFFDEVDITKYCTAASVIRYTPGVGEFNDSLNVGGSATQAARLIDGDSQMCLNRGDIITGQTSGATAVVVGQSHDNETNTHYLYVVNIKQTFNVGEQIVGSNVAENPVAATGTINQVTLASTGGDLKSNSSGDLQLLFNIPNTEAVKFRTGTREFKLVDVAEVNGDFTSRGRTTYTASGVLETKQQTINAVRNATLVDEVVRDNRVIVQTSNRVVRDTGWYDPLAQTFLVQQAGGAFLTKVDVFFASKDQNMPVTMEIREVVNGYPGKSILPFSKVTIKPSAVNISNNTVSVNGVIVPSYDTPTTFEFPSPVYVQDNQEYAIVLLSDSNDYRVWVSQLGDVVPGTSRTISEQPYAGVLFKSQNASTWTADQTQDLKFTLYRAKFQTNTIANVEFVNTLVSYDNLAKDPFETRNGVAKIRVWHRDHGMPVGSRVQITNSDSGLLATAINGVPAAQIYTTHVISDVDLDSYCITVSTAPNVTGYGGGITIRATRNIQYDCIKPLVQLQTFPETTTRFSLVTTTGRSVDSSQGAYQLLPAVDVSANENNYFDTPRMVAAQVNETNLLGNNKSATFRIQMVSTNDSVSPIVDTHRVSAILVNNKVNDPAETNINVPGLDYNAILTAATDITFSTNTMLAANASSRAAFKTVMIGKYLTITGSTSGEWTGLVSNIAADGSSITFTTNPSAIVGNVTIVQRELFVDEIAPVGSSTYSKYVTKKINLANVSNFLKIRLAGCIPSEADVQVYYRVATSGGSTQLDSRNYILLNPEQPIVKVQNGSNVFSDVSYSTGDIESFGIVQVKIVLKSRNSSAVPRIKDLRIIACA